MPNSIVLSHSVTVGQITFILRVVIQILSYGGLALISILILANAPRLASIGTHDVISRNVGASTTTLTTIKWIFSRLRRKSPDPYPSTNLLLILLLAISYTVFAALSDIGFLGFHACDVPASSFYDTPASVNSTEHAIQVISDNMAYNTDYKTVTAFRCDSSTLVKINSTRHSVLEQCNDWKNGTYGDPSFFAGLNSTDSDVLMLRQLRPEPQPNTNLPINTYNQRYGTVLDPNVVIIGGMALDPHENGLTAVIGVPNLRPQFKVTLDKAMAVEVDIGCMSVGIDATGSGSGLGVVDFFINKGDWRKFTGPEYMRDALTEAVDTARDYLLPYFSRFPPDENGTHWSNESLSGSLSPAASVGSWYLPDHNKIHNDNYDIPPLLETSCTLALQRKLGLWPRGTQESGHMCEFFSLEGTLGTNDGFLSTGLERMICAAATQVNMVHATVEMDTSSKITMSITRLPSRLNQVRADYWDIETSGGSTGYGFWDAYERYTLSDDSDGDTQHFIHVQSNDAVGWGVGSAGITIPNLVGFLMSSLNLDDDAYRGAHILQEGYNALNYTRSTKIVTQWVAQVGSSLLANSVGYNGWAGKNAAPLLVVSTGGHLGTCYKTPYAAGFLPLLLAACIIIIWCIFLLVTRSIGGTSIVKEAYSGVSPYIGAVYPGSLMGQLFVWEKGIQPRLEIVSKEIPIVENSTTTTLTYLNSPLVDPQD